MATSSERTLSVCRPTEPRSWRGTRLSGSARRARALTIAWDDMCVGGLKQLPGLCSPEGTPAADTDVTREPV